MRAKGTQGFPGASGDLDTVAGATTKSAAGPVDPAPRPNRLTSSPFQGYMWADAFDAQMCMATQRLNVSL